MMLDFDSFDYFEDFLAMSLVAVPAFYLLRRSWMRCALLGMIGVYLLYLIAPRLALFYIAFWLLQFGLQHAVRGWPSENTRWTILAAAIVVSLAPMVIWKTAPTLFIVEFNVVFNDLVDSGSSWLGAVDRARDIILPIGLSFATFRAIDLLVKVHLELVDPLRPTQMFAFGFFPPVQVIGPVIEVTEVLPALDNVSPAEPRKILNGLLLVALGLVKVFGVSFVFEPAGSVFSPLASGAAWEFWVELFRFAIFFYFNFSGFSDIAVGAGLIFGFTLQPNFNNPYLKTNPQDFWNSWHMSLTKFCQRNVFIPLGGMRAGRQYLAIMATIMVIAMWHDLTIPLVLFGLYHGAGLVGHRYLATKRTPSDSRWWYPVKVASLFVFFCLSLPLLLLRLEQIPEFYLSLVGGSQ